MTREIESHLHRRATYQSPSLPPCRRRRCAQPQITVRALLYHDELSIATQLLGFPPASPDPCLLTIVYFDEMLSGDEEARDGFVNGSERGLCIVSPRLMPRKKAEE